MKKIVLFFLLAALHLGRLYAQDQPIEDCGSTLDDSTLNYLNRLEPEIQRQLSAWRATGDTPETPVSIPVKFHIIRESNGSGTPQLDASAVVDLLNTKFSGTGFAFTMCGDVSYINNSLFYEFSNSYEDLLRQTAYLPGVINLYIAHTVEYNGTQVNGYAPTPDASPMDLIVIRSDVALKSTVPHEFGHYFGLYHTYGQGNCNNSQFDEWANGCNCAYAGDRICDTPADPGMGCLPGLINYDSCKYINTGLMDDNHDFYNPMVTNLMSYTGDCREGFTPEQKARMVVVYQQYRKYLSCPNTSCTAPYSVYAFEVTNTSARINWVAASSAIGHEFELKAGNGPWLPLNPGPYTEANYLYLNNLSQSTTYKCRVRSLCGYGAVSDWRESSPFTTLAPCNTPTNLSTNLLGTSYVQFSWNAVSGAQSYNIEVRHIGSPIWYKSVTTSGSSFLFPATNEANIQSDRGLGSNTPYEWRIRAYCGNNMYSNWSTPVPFTTPSTSCNSPLPGELIVQSISPYSVTIKCTKDAYSYKFRRHPGGHQVDLGFYDTYTFSTDPCTTYEIECLVRCSSSSETSRYSAPLIITTPGCTNCALPAVTTTASTTSNSATLTWSAAPGAVNYFIQWQTGNGPWTDLSPTPFWGTSTTVYNLTPGAHKWRIRSNCVSGQGTGWSAAIPVNISAAACEVVELRGLKVYELGQTAANLVWYPPGTGQYNYTVWYRPQGGSWLQTTTSSTQKIITGLTPGVTYYWQVQINCPGNQNGPWSTGVNFTTLPLPTLSASPASQNVSYNAGATTISVNTNIEWRATVSANAPWLTICPSGGVNSGTITASFPANTGASSRTATVTIIGSGITRTVTITQSANPNPNCSNDNEPANNTPAGAPALALNTDKQSQIGASGDIDYWKFSLPATQNVEITLKTLPGDYDIKLYDANGTELGSSTLGRSNDESIVKNNLPAGTYSLKIYGYNGVFSNTQCYTLKVAATAANSLSVSPAAKNVGAGAGSETLTVSSNIAWTATDNASWMSLSPGSGSNNGTLTATFSANSSASPRTASITVSGGGLTQTATITQAGYASPNCSNDAEPANNALSTAPTIALNADKLSQIGTYGDVDYWKFSLSGTQTATISLSTLPFDYDVILLNSSGVQLAISENANTSSESITLTLAAGTYYVKVYGYNGAYSSTQCYTLRVVTSASNSLSITPASQSAPANAGTVTFTISSNVPWMVTDNASWLSLSPVSGSNNGTLTATFSANSSAGPRTATITVSGGGLTQTATITQAGYANPNCSKDAEPANNALSTAPTIALNADKLSQIGTYGDVDYWKFSLSSTQTTAISLSTLPFDYDVILLNSSGVQLAISENANTNSESITLTLAAGSYFVKIYGYNNAYSGTQCYTLRVATAAPNTLSVAPASQSAPANAGTATFAISANVPWTATENASWLSLSPVSGSNNGTLTATFSANSSSSPRTATITVSGGGLTQTATLIQAGATAGCASPANLETSSITQNTATLSWNSVSGATGYQVQFLINGNWLNVGSPTANLSMGVYGLTPNNSYQWRVIALCNNGQQSSPAATVTFSTPYATNCTGGTQSPAYALNPSANWQYQSNLWGGHYCLVNVQAGTIYTFSFCSADGASIAFDGQLSIKNTSDALLAYSDDFCGLAPKLVWQSNFTGQVRVLLTRYNCQTQQSNSTLAYKTGNTNFNSGEPDERSDVLTWAPVPVLATGQQAGADQTEAPENPSVELEVFPNPASGQFTIALKNGGVIDIAVTDQFGKVLWRAADPSGLAGRDTIVEVNTADWLAGVYLVRVRCTDGNSLSRKVVVIR